MRKGLVFGLKKKFENFYIFKIMKQLEKKSPSNPSVLREIQLKKLKKLVIHAYSHYDFYKGLMDDAGFNPHCLKTLEDIRKIPTLDKGMYRDFIRSVVKQSPDFYKRNYYFGMTSGSTGTPLEFYRFWEERAYVKAKFLRILKLNGYKLFDKTYWISPPQRLNVMDSVFQKLGIMPRYNVSLFDTPENFLKVYQEVMPDIVIANKTHLVQLALSIKNSSLDIKRPKLCVSLAETLDQNARQLINEVFGDNKLIDVYSCVELSPLAYQLKGGSYYYFFYDTNIVELDDNGHLNLERGNCIITDLHIYSFPIIRYEVGDWLEMEEIDGIPMIKYIRGRMDDWIIWRDGTKIPFYYFYTILGHMIEIRQYRVIQETYDLILVKIIVDYGVNKEALRKRLINAFHMKIRSDVTYKVEFVNYIPPDPSGKLRMVISKVQSHSTEDSALT